MTSPWVWKVLGSVAALLAGAAAVGAMDAMLRRQQQKIDADRAAAAERDLQAGADAEQPETDAAEQPEAQAETAAGQPVPGAGEPAAETGAAAESEAPADGEKAAAPRPEGFVPGDPHSGPNPNPVLAGKTDAPRTPDGRVDAEKICSPEDFGNWEDLGCQG
jgi:hypothetical protein